MKKFLVNIILVSIVMLICCLMLELFFRMFYPQNLKVFNQFDALLGWKNIPGTHITVMHKDYRMKASVNSHGLRSPEYLYHKDEDVKRLLVLGDSYTWGEGVSDKETYSFLLNQFLGNKMEVINAGVDGYSTDQEYLWLKHIGYKYNSDVVLVALCLNDLTGNLLGASSWRNIAKPSFVLDQKRDDLLLTGVPVFKDKFNDSIFTSIHGYLKGRSHFYDFLKKRLLLLEYSYSSKAGKPISVSRKGLKRWEKRRKLLGYANEGEFLWAPYKKNIPENVKNGWVLTFKILDEMRKFSKERQAQFVIMLVPYRYEFYQEDLTAFAKRYNLNADDYDFFIPHKIVKDYCLNNQIKCIFLSEDFKNKSKEKRLYFENDEHWTAYGHQETAKIINAYLQAQGFLKN